MRKSSLVVLVVAIVFAGFVFYSLFHVEPVRVVSSHLEHRDGAVYVDGKVRNTGPDTGPLDLEVHYFDASGRALGQEKVVVKGLKRGAEASFKTSPQEFVGASEFSIYLNHGRDPYGN